MKIVDDDLSAVDYTPFHGLIRKWMEARQAENVLPVYSGIDKENELYEYRMVAEIRHNPLSVHYMDVGIVLEDLYGDKIAGKNLEELYNDWFRKMAYLGYQKAIEAKRPVYDRRTISTIIKPVGYHKLHLPYGRERVYQAVTYIVPMDNKWRKKQEWQSIVEKTPWL